MTDLLHNPEPLFWIDGHQVELAQDALRVEVAEDVHGLKTLQVRLLAQGPHDSDPEHSVLYLDGPPIDIGKTIEVSLGAGEDARTVFKGTLSAVEANFEAQAEPNVVLFAEDSLMKLRMTRRSKTYENKTDAQIAEAIAQANGLTAEATATGPTYEYVQQWNQSDLAFLRDRAWRVNAELWVRDDVLHFKSRGQRQGTNLTLTRGNDLIEVQVRADLAHQRTKVTVSGYDVSARDLLERDATGSVVQGEAENGRTGVSILEGIGERRSFRVRDVPLVAGEALAFAKAEMERRARSFVIATGVTNGHPDLEVGSRLTLERIGKPFTGGGYYVTRIRHTWDRKHGFRTHFEAERPMVRSGT